MPTLTLKIECECGTRYKFDVEPEGGKMPVEVFCPHCGIDGTDEANRQIEVELARLSGAPAPPRIEVPKPYKAESPDAGLKLAGKRPPQHTVTLAPQSGKPGIGNPCGKHPKETTVNSCLFCKRPICPVCMSKFGYFCSTACHHQAEQRGMKIPIYEKQESRVREQKYKRTKRIIVGSCVLAAVLVVFWIWYSFFGSKPRVKYSAQIDKADHVEYCRFAGPGQILLKTDRILGLYDARGLQPIWTTSLAPYEEAAPTGDEGPTPWELEQERIKAKEEYERTGKRPEFKWKGKWKEPKPPTPEEMFLNRFSGYVPYQEAGMTGGGRVRVQGDEIWILYPENLVVFDRKTGKEKKKIAVRGKILQLTPGDSVIFATATGRPNEGQLTRVAFRTGDVQVDKFTLPAQEKRKFGLRAPIHDAGSDLLGEMSAGVDMAMSAGTELEYNADPHELRFVPAGLNVARLDIELLKQNIVARQVLKPEDIKPKEEPGTSGPLKVTDAIDMAKQMQYEALQKMGGIIEKTDRSTYRVTVRRHLEEGAPSWSGEVIGPPTFVPLKTVDALVSSGNIVVFEKEGDKLWESALAFPAGEVRVDFGGGVRGPCCEVGNALYLYDSQALTSYELTTGKVRWRMPLPGVTSLQLDPAGGLYLASVDAVSKVDPETGKVRWKLDKKGVDFFISGKYIYLSRAQTSGADMIQHMWTGKEIPTHFRIHRVDPKTGLPLWEYYRSKSPAAMDFHHNQIVLMFAAEYRKDPQQPMGKPLVTPGELQVLKYLTF